MVPKRKVCFWTVYCVLILVLFVAWRFAASDTFKDPIISFTIGGVEYQADRGMTWGEWVLSDYNTDGFFCNELNRNYGKYDNANVYKDSTNSSPIGRAARILVCNPTRKEWDTYGGYEGVRARDKIIEDANYRIKEGLFALL